MVDFTSNKIYNMRERSTGFYKTMWLFTINPDIFVLTGIRYRN